MKNRRDREGKSDESQDSRQEQEGDIRYFQLPFGVKNFFKFYIKNEGGKNAQKIQENPPD